MNIRSLPVQLGVDRAARVACWIMALPQVVVIVALIAWQQPVHAVAVGFLLLQQLVLMDYFLASPKARALFYSGFGVPLFVSGMLVSAFALRSVVQGGG
jgi:chlorophyll synthase